MTTLAALPTRSLARSVLERSFGPDSCHPDQRPGPDRHQLSGHSRKHHDLLQDSGHEIVCERGSLTEVTLLGHGAKPRVSQRRSHRDYEGRAIIFNAARGGLEVDMDIVEACKSGKLHGYGTNVVDPKPMVASHVFPDVDNIIATPHIGSRTLESVERQALMSTENLLRVLDGKAPMAQANEV